MNPYLMEAALKHIEPYLRSRGRAIDFDRLNALLYTQDFEAFLGADETKIERAFASYDRACGYGPTAAPVPHELPLSEPVRLPSSVDTGRLPSSPPAVLGGPAVARLLGAPPDPAKK